METTTVSDLMENPCFFKKFGDDFEYDNFEKTINQHHYDFYEKHGYDIIDLTRFLNSKSFSIFEWNAKCLNINNHVKMIIQQLIMIENPAFNPDNNIFVVCENAAIANDLINNLSRWTFFPFLNYNFLSSIDTLDENSRRDDIKDVPVVVMLSNSRIKIAEYIDQSSKCITKWSDKASTNGIVTIIQNGPHTGMVESTGEIVDVEAT